LLSLPEVITNEVNRLIDRRGKATTFRSQRFGTGDVGASLTFGGDLMPGETFISADIQSYREWQLRTAVTYTLKFPKVDIPLLREDLLDLKWGSDPNPTDVYNLVPWTWLVDWFSGLGQYIDLINTLANDRSLFNYGYLTYLSKGSITRRSLLRLNSTCGVTFIAPNSSWTDHSSSNYNQDVQVSYKYQRRVDISTLDDVKCISRPTTLSSGQLAIIGALLSKWAHS
jgi:hypothetical protein